MSKIIYHDFRRAGTQTRNSNSSADNGKTELPYPAWDALGERLASARRIAELRRVEREATEAMRAFETGGDTSRFSAPIREFASALAQFNPRDYNFALYYDNNGWWIQPERRVPPPSFLGKLAKAILGG